ncbi:MAG: nucleoside 2-deoxyribosyltransferase domain-containing protein [Candidatus Buchananbacteria bacterium]|nr:nucleoside 2-deoxyribosyltransferase domain-containing protein [Candidatus Buchananbacteria bacterium]
MIVVYAKEPWPGSISKSIFLVGPTPRDKVKIKSWRPEALRILEELGYDGIVFVPEDRNGKWEKGEYINQVEWEENCLNIADCIVAWVPRDMATMPALTTNTEWGVWCDSGKIVFGAPPEAVAVTYQKYYAGKYKVPISTTLEDTLKSALAMIGEGAIRTGGECQVPLYIWRTPHFQNWYQAQKQAGNRLDGAKVLWTWRVGPKKDIVFFFAIHVDVYIASEGRNKTNEVVISRPDISTVMMYKPDRDNIANSDIVLIREFRSPAANCFVWELPGGSSFRLGVDSLQLAADECLEETGLKINPVRMRAHQSRQLIATLSSHQAHLFSVELTDEELAWLKSQEGIVHGVIEDSERTYIEVVKLGDILLFGRVDWSMLGMILSVLNS